MDNNLIQKSVRLSSDLVAWVDEQEGRDFSKKLVGILVEYRSGEAERLQTIELQKASIEDYGKRLQEYRNLFYKSSEIFRRVSELLPDLEDLSAMLADQ